MCGRYRALGARIGTGCFIDSTDLADFDMINIGDDVAVGAGVTLIGHAIKGGCLHFNAAGLLTRAHSVLR